MIRTPAKLESAYDKAGLIAESLKKDIRSKKLCGKLPSELDLAKRYKVNIKTANKALSKLIDTGFVYRRRGIGTFVHDEASKIEESFSEQTIALFMPSQGHLFEDLYQYLTKALKENHIYPILMNHTGQTTVDESHGLIDQAVRFKCRMLLVAHQLASQFDFEYLRTKQDLFERIFIINCHTKVPVKALKISSDTFNGVYQAVSHLISGGRRKILFVNHEDGRSPGSSKAYKDEDYYGGYCAALRDHGLEGREMDFGEGRDDNENIRKLEEILKRKDRPDGIFCVQDNRATRCVKAAFNLGLRIPEDLAIVGYYNTPWSRFSLPTLSSVSIGEKKISEILCEKIASAEFQPGEMLVKPQLIIRESSENSEID